MADNAVSTLAPEGHASDVLESPAASSSVSPLNTDKQLLFDSISQEGFDEEFGPEGSTLKSLFTVFLWSGYAIAIVVAVVLVWSAAKEMLR
jgi:hypothetical protein